MKRILDGRKGILVPGRQVSRRFLYEEYLSDLLNCPIFSRLGLVAGLGENKCVWEKY